MFRRCRSSTHCAAALRWYCRNRRRWAERWQLRALALGYERLELVDSQRRLLARGALVGSGMILLDPGAPG
jgi:hypothetical protein